MDLLQGKSPTSLYNKYIQHPALCPASGPAGVDAKLCRWCKIFKQALLAGAPEVSGIMGPEYDSFK